MKPNINNSDFQATKKILSANNVPQATIDALAKAMKNGFKFTEPKDLEILNIPVRDLGVIRDVFEVAPLPTGGTAVNIQTYEFTFEPSPVGGALYGFSLAFSYLSTAGFTTEETYPINDTRRVIFDIDLANIRKEVAFFIKNSKGEKVDFKEQTDASRGFGAVKTYDKTALKNQIFTVKIEAQTAESSDVVEPTYRIKGKLICSNSSTKLDGYEVVIFANTKEDNLEEDYFPVCHAKTETNGYFITNFLDFSNRDDINKVKFAKAKIIKERVTEVGIRLEEYSIVAGETTTEISRIPEKLILFIEENAESGDCDCGCGSLDFHEKKVLQEQSYYFIVRTTEPSVEATELLEEEEIDVSDILPEFKTVPRSVLLKAYQATRLNNSIDFVNRNKLLAATPALKPVVDTNVLKNLLAQYHFEKAIKKQKRVLKGRVLLDPLNAVDWDETATIYQATSIAHGHILHYKQEWIADGYSIGDILYSLPLAPGQKKQIAVVDFDRTERASNTQSLTFEERLNNTLIRDRDINEVVSGVLSENITASSEANTGGFGVGFGAAAMGIIDAFSLGSVFGISGGQSSSGSTATQNSLRESSAMSAQSLVDRTTQSANAVRSQRATVVQTVAQGERSEAIAESVANYNHCHAITIQYFEVLRHFLIQTRLADVQECLFVPLKMTQFDIDKALRWRNSLSNRLIKRSLLRGFDALARIQNEQESATENYYDSIGFPRNIYAEEELAFLEGEFYLEFLFMNPLDLNAELLLKFQKFGVFGLTLGVVLKDDEFARVVGPILIEKVLDFIKIEYVKSSDSSVDILPLELTLVSPFVHKKRLYISARMTEDISAKKIKRQDIKAIQISYDTSRIGADLEDFKYINQKHMKVLIRSGAMRYRTKNLSENLFTSSRIDNDLFVEGDNVLISTALLNNREMRNPRAEDVDLANNLIHHLNENLEYYHKCIWMSMSPERRFMLLDGIIAPGKGGGRSVASVVENKIIGIAGNSLIMPVAAGNQLDPSIDEDFNLFAQYFNDSNDPIRISLPTKGVYAESVMGKCNSCEEKDESRFWRWEESPIPDSPQTQIAPLSTDSRRADPGDLQPKDFPSPIVNIQNAPSAPDPTGLQSLIQLLGKGDSFRDLTGLNQNQLNALATFQKSLDTAQAFGKEASELAKAAAANQLIQEGKKSGALSNEKATELTEKNIGTTIPATSEEQIASAQKQLNLIDNLEEQGRIERKDAVAARNNILSELLKTKEGIKSKGDIIDLIKASSDSGADLKVDDGQIEIKSQSASLGAKGILDIQSINNSQSKTFNPGVRDPSGESIMKSDVSQSSLSKVKNYNWKEVGSTNKLVIGTPKNATTKISAILPGLTKLRLEVSDENNQILDFDETPICCPQFVFVAKGNATYTTIKPALADAHLFDAVLREFKVSDSETRIYEIAKSLSQQLLKRINVRVAWGVLGEKTPTFIGVDNANLVLLQGWPRDGKDKELGLTELSTTTSAAEFPNELIFIWLGQLENNADFNLILADYLSLANIASPTTAQKTALAEAKNVWVTILGRVLGYAMSHEIVHSLLGLHVDLDASHTPSTEPIDLISPVLSPAMIGLEFVDPTKPKNIKNIKGALSTFVPLNADNLQRLMQVFPTPPAPPFV